MSDDERDWRAPDAKRMTFDEMAARAQYEWDRAEKAEAEAANYSARIEALEAELPRALTEQRRRLCAEHDKDREELKRVRQVAKDLIEAGKARAAAAERALAEAVEVMRPFGDLSQRYDDTVSDGWVSWFEFITDHARPSETECKAARAFVQQHEGKK